MGEYESGTRRGLFPGAVHAHRYPRGKIKLVSASGFGVELHRAFTELDIDVYQTDSKDDPDYTGRNLDSTSFDVIIEEPGEYKVCFRETKNKKVYVLEESYL